MAEERPLAESAYSRLLGVTGRYWQQSSYSKNAKFNGACSSCRPAAVLRATQSRNLVYIKRGAST
jgi:hypothetical protein